MLKQQQQQKITQSLLSASQLAERMYDDYVECSLDIGTSYKPDSSPVTQVDMAVHELMVASLAKITPNIPCLSEESADALSHRKNLDALWLLDPIDGTREFISKSGQFTINLALIHKHQVVAAWLVVPKRKQLYFCLQDGEVHRLSFGLQNAQPQHITPNCQSLEQRNLVRVGLSNSANLAHYEPFLTHIKQRFEVQTTLVQAGSALKYAMLLEDEIDLYIRLYPTYEWDTAAGQGLIEALGGCLVNFRQHPFLYNARHTLKNDSFVCFKCQNDVRHIMAACQAVSYSQI